MGTKHGTPLPVLHCDTWWNGLTISQKKYLHKWFCDFNQKMLSMPIKEREQYAKHLEGLHDFHFNVEGCYD